MSEPQVMYSPSTGEFILFEGNQIFKVSKAMRELLTGQGADLMNAAHITRLRGRIQELELENERLQQVVDILSYPVTYEVPSDYEHAFAELGEGDS